jgi:hypothetical protein
MLYRWDVRLLMAALNYVFDLMGLIQGFVGGEFGRSMRLYVEVLVLKEIFKVSLRALSIKLLDVKIPKSMLEG